MKKAEREHIGGEEINDTVEMAGWGVEEAEQKNKMDASKCLSPFSPIAQTNNIQVLQRN